MHKELKRFYHSYRIVVEEAVCSCCSFFLFSLFGLDKSRLDYNKTIIKIIEMLFDPIRFDFRKKIPYFFFSLVI